MKNITDFFYKMQLYVGLILTAIGVSCADSEYLILPIISVIAGTFMMNLTSKRDSKKL